jgi:hypothetical protein
LRGSQPIVPTPLPYFFVPCQQLEAVNKPVPLSGVATQEIELRQKELIFVCGGVKVLMLSDLSDDGCMAVVSARAREFMGVACQASPVASREFGRGHHSLPGSYPSIFPTNSANPSRYEYRFRSHHSTKRLMSMIAARMLI